MKNLYQLLAAGFIALLSSCSSESPGVTSEPEITPTPEVTPTPDVNNIRKTIELNAAEQAVSENMGEFNTAIFKAYAAEYGKRDENLLISPLSAAMYLSMQANYCSEETQQQIFKAIGSSDIDALNSFNTKMIASLGALDIETILALANSVWYDCDYTLKSGVEDALTAHFKAEFFPCNPLDKNIKDLVNNWIMGKTDDKIKDFYDGTQFLSMVINTLYYKSVWESPFDKKNTEKETFKASGKEYTVDMMKRTDLIENVAIANNFYACRREFGNGAYSCTFILPNEDGNIIDFIANLSYTDIAALDFRKDECELWIPRFELKGKIDEMKGVFAALGIEGLSTPLALDAITESITILGIKQQSYISINEEGAEGASVTGDRAITSTGEPPIIVPFKLNRPFLFMINETSTNACILMGCITKFD